MINKIGAYKAAVMFLNDDVHAFVQRRDGSVHGQSVPLLTDGEFDLGVYDIGLAWIGFTDEETKTEVLEFEDLAETNPAFVGVVFEIENLDTISVMDKGEAVPVEYLMSSGAIEDVFDKLFNDLFDKKPRWTKN